MAEAAAVTHPGPRALADGRFLLFLAGSFLVGIIFLQHSAAMPHFLVRDLGLSSALFGILFAIDTVLIVLLGLPPNPGGGGVAAPAVAGAGLHPLRRGMLVLGVAAAFVMGVAACRTASSLADAF